VLHIFTLPAFVTAMAWENRERGGHYYYRSIRDGGRVCKEYVGAGEFAEGLAHTDETIRLIREQERQRGRAEVENLEALAAPVLEVCEAAADVLARAVLVAGGYRRRKGEWRLTREQ
jgi:hypothetical protein